MRFPDSKEIERLQKLFDEELGKRLQTFGVIVKSWYDFNARSFRIGVELHVKDARLWGNGMLLSRIHGISDEELCYYGRNAAELSDFLSHWISLMAEDILLDFQREVLKVPQASEVDYRSQEMLPEDFYAA